MLKKIGQTTATLGISTAASKKLFTITSGEHSGRVLAIYMTAPNELVFSYADPPFKVWSTPTVVTGAAADLAFDAVMDSGGNVYVSYIENSSYSLAVQKLTFSSGQWSVGGVVGIYNGTGSFQPSITVDVNGRLWVCWAHLNTGTFDLRVKTSDDGGATWGSGPADPGETIKGDMAMCYPRIVVTSVKVFVVFTYDGNAIGAMSKTLGGTQWSSEFTIATGLALDDHFDAAVSGSGLLGVAFDDGQLCYREFNGESWGSIAVLDESEAKYPQVWFTANVPLVTYIAELATGQHILKLTHRRSGTFSTPELLEQRANVLNSLVLYHNSSASYADLTAAAASAEEADVYHPSSGLLVKSAGDAVFLGMDWPFRFIRILLSTPGSAGGVGYRYFDGSGWAGFSPAGGDYPLDNADKSLLLWDDVYSIPVDWQKCIVNGVSRYWVKIEVISDYVTGPIGSRFSTAANIQAFSCRR